MHELINFKKNKIPQMEGQENMKGRKAKSTAKRILKT
jgi:hypothetical protein